MANEDAMTGEELGLKMLAAAREMAEGKGMVVHPPVIFARIASGLSQTQFAELMGVSVGMLQGLEQGRRSPSGAAMTLLRVAESHPEVLRELAY